MLVLAILALILLTTLKEAWPALRFAGFTFVTSDHWIPLEVNGQPPVYGALSFVYGTAVTSIIALIFAVPISIGIALFLTELAPRRLRSTVVTVIDLLASIPSVVFGLWGIIVVGPVLLKVFKGLHSGLGPIPVIGSLFGDPITTGRSFMTAGIIVAIMIIPIITSITREVFATVPESDKQAAYALGATHWEMIKGAVFPHSFGGMVGAIMLGLGRAMGETIAVALTIGAATQVTPNLFASGNSLASVIALNFGDPGIPPGRSALIACGVLLFAITILINYAAEVIVRRAEIRMRGAAR
ncbi:MAG: phosphate ABC transporter permease subunit PstC [Micromonosporaceae bacterium]|nr:phosphate ABC transporter permease subunit PstC [Micromonosporaceae bacterium]